VLASGAHVPARFEKRLVDETMTRRLLVELKDRGDLLTLLLQLLELRFVHFSGTLRFEPLLRFLFQSRKNGLVLRFGEAQLFEGLLRLAIGGRVGRGRRIRRRVCTLAAIDLEVEPASDVKELVEAIEREIALNRATWMGSVVARLPHRMELV